MSALPLILTRTALKLPKTHCFSQVWRLNRVLVVGTRTATTHAPSSEGNHWTDFKFPNMDDYYRGCMKDPSRPSIETEERRKAFNAFFTVAAVGTSLIYTKYLLHLLADIRAIPLSERYLSTIEVKLDEIPEGKTKMITWQGKPVFIKHRTAAEIEREQAVSVDILRDPQADSVRTKNPEWTVIIGVCTHLGCIPLADKGHFGGWFCPCHGSHYDGAGRVRKGPAPLNMAVPPVKWVSEELAIIGTE